MESTQYKEVSPYGSLYTDIVKQLDSRMVGQDHAKRIVAKYLCNAYNDIQDEAIGPLGVFFLYGPTGVGKSMLAQETSMLLYGDPDGFTKIECELLTNSYDKSKLFGSPKGLIGYNDGALLDSDALLLPHIQASCENQLHKISAKLHQSGVLVFDEIEKMHPQVIQSLLNLLDTGKVTLSNGKIVDITNFLVFMTSNLGQKGKRSHISLGNRPAPSAHHGSQTGSIPEIDRHFSAEFLGRIDEFIGFEEIDGDHTNALIQKYKEELDDALNYYSSGRVHLSISDEAFELFKDKISGGKGARSTNKKRADLVAGPLGSLIKKEGFLKKERLEVNNILLDVKDDEFVFLHRLTGEMIDPENIVEYSNMAPAEQKELLMMFQLPVPKTEADINRNAATTARLSRQVLEMIQKTEKIGGVIGALLQRAEKSKK